MDNTYYIKKGRKYIPIGGHSLAFDNIADGIWLVQSKPGRRSSSSILYRADHNFNVFHDITSYAEEIETVEVLVNIIKDMVDKKEFVVYNHSMYEIAEKVSKELYSQIRKLKAEKKKRG